MVFSTRTLAAFALGLSALSFSTPTRRAPSLSVAVSAPNAVDSVADAKITVAVTNTGSESVKVLKYGTALDAEHATKSFVVTRNGKEAAFSGIKMQVNPTIADDSAFVVIPAGETVTAVHDVADLYDFATLGAGAFTFTPVDTFQAMPADLERTLVPKDQLKVSVASVEVNVEKDVTKRELRVHAKRARVVCSNSSQSSAISASYTEGKSLAAVAANYISSNGASTLFRAYFGSSSTTTIRSRFTSVANENSSTRTLSCSDPYGACSGGVIAYTLISTTNIYYCSPFYSEVTTSRLCSGTTVASRNIRGGTTLHELTHALVGTTDVGYGCSYDQQLAASSPSQAASNADNYNCFATQVYASTQC